MADPQALAEFVVRSHWGSRLPVDPEAVGRALGVQVEPLPQAAHPGPSGHYTVADGVPTLRFNPTVSDTIRRFAMAHGVGHHALNHGPRPVDSTPQFEALQWDDDERAANAFALALLMPAEAVGFFLDRAGEDPFHDLCARFGVSEVAMRVRLKQLRLLP